MSSGTKFHSKVYSTEVTVGTIYTDHKIIIMCRVCHILNSFLEESLYITSIFLIRHQIIYKNKCKTQKLN